MPAEIPQAWAILSFKACGVIGLNGASFGILNEKKFNNVGHVNAAYMGISAGNQSG